MNLARMKKKKKLPSWVQAKTQGERRKGCWRRV
jgi:hypothetical protein